MTRSVLSLAILFAALTGSLLLTGAVRSDTGDDSQATKPQDNGHCPAMCEPLNEEEYDYYYEGYGCDTPLDAPKCENAEENIASDPAEDEGESASEVEAEEYTHEDADYWYDSDTEEYYDYDFADDGATEEMIREEPAEDESSILVEDASIATTEEDPAYDVAEHTHDDMYDYEDEYAYDYDEYAEPSVEEQVEETSESVVTEESEEEYDDYWDCDDNYWNEEQDSHFEEESVELVEDTPEASTEEDVDDFDYGYEYWEQYEQEYAAGMEDVDDSQQVAEETADEEVTEESDEFDYGYEYWDEYDYYYEEAEEAELVESREEGDLGADAELECWMEVDLENMMVASRQPQQTDNDREAILSLARSLDRVGTALQTLSRHLTEMADEEVAELPTSDETIQR